MNVIPTQPNPAGRLAPLWPACWYTVARSADVRPGMILTGTLAHREYVLFRTANGTIAALDAHCPHMGAHLRHGVVVGEQLQCSLHHRRFDTGGRCQHPNGRLAGTRSWPVVEKFGLIFLYPGYDRPSKLPALTKDLRYVWTVGKPFRLSADWRHLPINAFDITHLTTVHHRRLVGPPEFIQHADCATLSYVSEVEGGGWSDRYMKYLSGNRIHVNLTCFGPVMCVESRVGRHRTAAVLGYTAHDSDVVFFSAFGIEPRGRLDPLRLAAAKWLFTAFLKKDIRIIGQMALDLTSIDDPGVDVASRFLASLRSLTP